MNTQIELMRQNLPIAEAFATKYQQLEEIDHDLSIYSFGVWLKIPCGEDENRDKIIAGVGQLLGRDGWVTDEEYGGKFLNWKRTIDGVEITIVRAEKLDTPPVGFPVPATKFPLMLMEVE